MWDTVKDPSNWPYLMGAMTPADREKLALAYEAGNGKAVGEILGANVANLPIGGGGLGTIKKVGGLPNGSAVTRLDVDEYKNLTKNSPVGDGLDNHHVPQKTIAQDVVPGYPQDKTAGSAPAITLTKAEHTYITGQQNANQAARSLMNPRDLLADDARMLREIGVPNDKIQQIIELNKVKYGFNK
jgi:hypothetical protein